MDDVLSGYRVVPVLALNDPHAAGWLAEQLVDGGLPIVEVTFRTERATDVLAVMARNPGLMVGAGTVTTGAQVQLAHQVGARFVVSPGLSEEVIRACRAIDMPVIPGVATATEIMAALELGLRTLKFFPAERLGGVTMLSALAPVFPDVSFVPTGGITAANARQYLDLASVLAIGGSWMLGKDCLEAKDTSAMSVAIAQAVALVNEGKN